MGRVSEHIAKDHNTEANGLPFKFSLDRKAAKDIQKRFGITPIRVEDNQGTAATSVLWLVIGDKKYNPPAPPALSSTTTKAWGPTPRLQGLRERP